MEEDEEVDVIEEPAFSLKIFGYTIFCGCHGPTKSPTAVCLVPRGYAAEDTSSVNGSMHQARDLTTTAAEAPGAGADVVAEAGAAGAAPATAGPPAKKPRANFSGKWRMVDIKGDPEGVFAHLGVPWTARKAISAMGWNKAASMFPDKELVNKDGNIVGITRFKDPNDPNAEEHVSEDVHVIGEGHDLSTPPKKRVISWSADRKTLKMDIVHDPAEHWEWKMPDPDTLHVTWCYYYKTKKAKTLIQVMKRVEGFPPGDPLPDDD